jgi:AAA+ ATPase superfamily predicted ATPase
MNLLKRKFEILEKGEFGVVYGRRRTGKSELLRQFYSKVKNQEKLFLTVTSVNRNDFMQLLSDKIKESFGDIVKINQWADFFDYLLNRPESKKKLLIIDEFQRINNFAKDFFFSLQEYWDSKLRFSKFMILICGSSMSMMHRIALEEHGPLYGRKTFELHLKPFKYIDFREMFKDFSEEEKIKIFAIFGGTPKYLEDFKYSGNKNYFEAYESIVLTPNSALFEEPLNALKFELKNPDRYVSILKSISTGKIESPEIAQNIGVKNNYLSPYLKTLIELLDIIEQNDPLFGKGRNKRYKIKDNFFRFWYKFVYPYREHIEIGNTKFIINKISRDFESYCGRIFEDIVEEFFIFMNGKQVKNKNIDFEKIGKWWENREDIDLVLKCRNEVIFIEVKFKDKEIGFDCYNELVRKSKKTSASGKFSYILVSRKGFKDDLIKNKPNNLMLLSLKDLEKIWDEESGKMSYSQESLFNFI